MAFWSISFILVLLGATSTLADYETEIEASYNDNCPDLSSALGSGCDVTASDCTEITCKDQSLGENDLTLKIKVNKCDDPPAVDITVKALGLSWSHTFNTDERIAVPGLSVKVPLGKASGGIYLKVQLEDTGSNLKLKIILLSGFELFDGKFQEITSLTLAESDLPISTWECGIVRWWNSLTTILKVLVVCGGLVVLGTLGTCCCCCCCRCCRTKSSGTVVVVPPAPTTVTSTNTNVPMQPFVNEI